MHVKHWCSIILFVFYFGNKRHCIVLCCVVLCCVVLCCVVLCCVVLCCVVLLEIHQNKRGQFAKDISE